MLESTIKIAICKIRCGTESGSGWLIRQNIVITAYHCVEKAIKNDEPIKLGFNFSESLDELTAEIIDYDEDLDIALLSLEKIDEYEPIPFNDVRPIERQEFYSHGWPVVKLEMGHKLQGSIVQVTNNLKLGNDIELQIDSPNSLDDYSGHSGAPLICDGMCFGIIRYSIEKTIGAISVFRIREFLIKNNILEEELIDKGVEIPKLAPRTEFNTIFDEFLINNRGKYIFLEGAHGIGKSTFCGNYRTQNPSIENFNTYSFTHNRDLINVALLAQPVEFVNWLNMQVSMLVNGSSGVALKDEYAQLIKETQNVIQALGQYYSSINKIGVLFIDGIDEIDKHDRELLKKFLGLLPQVIPSSLVIVLSAPSYTQYSALLGNKLRQETCITLPSLSYEITQQFCIAALAKERCDPVIVKLICDKAEGHPLYLRYLVDLVNDGKSYDDIAKLPLLEGSILNYYESLWHQLSSDTDGINLLAIMVRLRWGIPISLLVTTLNANEQAVLISTIERIKHLLLSSDNTNVYHSSFSEFLKEKTHLRENDIQLRLFNFCENSPDVEYGMFNIIYHGLKTLNTDKSLVISYCNQDWADKCVLRGIKPDTLLGDIEDVIKAVTDLGDFTETNRILLLSQRMKFRYDTLFAQSADLKASALISLDKSTEVLQHIIRYKQLIIPIELALKISLQLIEVESYKDARILLKTIETKIAKVLELIATEGLSIPDFLTLFDLQLQQYMLKSQALVQGADTELRKFQYYWLKLMKSCIQDEEESKQVRQLMAIYLQSNFMCLMQRPFPLEVLREIYSGPITDYIEQYIWAAVEYNTRCNFFDIPYDQNLLNKLFEDINTLVTENEGTLGKFDLGIIDCLISLGSPPNIMTSIEVEDTVVEFQKIAFIADDNVSLNETAFNEAMTQWRTQAYLNPDVPKPNILVLLESDWMDWLFSLTKILAWCDGLARRFKEENDLEQLDSIWKVIHQDIFQNLKFRLFERVNWKDAYTLPENIFPHIYKNLTLLILDIYPTYLEELLTFIHERFSNQCGIYSEGFRGILNNVLEQVTKYELEDDVEDLAFSLLERWENFILLNLKNRHELVPELLTIIPLYERLNALEKAKNSYRHVLAFSMGPNWYKEDQLGLAVSTLAAIDIQTPLKNGVLSKIAGLLEVSSGEMTFERFVRYAKRDFIKTLCLRGEFDKAIRYYIRQTYGSLGQMYADITKGEIDRLSELAGTRFPGGALDEQDSILCIVRAATPHLEWQFCWVLLEIFQFGDSRHLANYAEVYGKLLTANQGDIVAIEQMFSRLEIIYESELTNDERSNFISELKKHIPESLCDRFQNYFGSYIDILGSNKQESKKTSVVQTNAKENIGVKQDTFDSLFTPGIFGTSTSYAQVEAYFSSANKAIKRKNHKQAQQDILTALKTLQLGQWPIWDALVPEMKRGQKLLKETTCSQEDLIRLFQPLIVNERYAQHWFIAENLISWLSPDASVDDQNKLLELTINHIELMVGVSEAEVADYSFLEECNQKDKVLCFVQLIVHAIDHPTWLRSEKAAEMLLWLLRNYPKYIHLFGQLAFSNNASSHAEVICGVLDQLSYSESKLWDFLSPSLDFSTIIKDCKHIGRLSILKRILNQAAKNGNENANQLLVQLKREINQVNNSIDNNAFKYPQWAMCLQSEWSQLKKLGVVNSALVQQTTSILETLCSPLTLEIVHEIEKLLSDGYYANKNDPIRWRAKVSYALQTALQSTAPISLHEKIVEIFRPYNPTRLDHLRIRNFKPHGEAWLISQPEPIFDRHIYLDYYESFWHEGDLRQIRMTAYWGEIPQTPISSGRFSSTELPSLNKELRIDICANVDPTLAYFGSFTPAIPTSQFMQISNIDSKSLKRAWWRSSRCGQVATGAPQSEGCYLSVYEDEFLELQNKMNIFWIVEIDSHPCGLISYQ
ncbi:AVAST type 1 anti-phage system protease Avs1b [Acinetobacter soli]|uniref:AVAST type 1 anti-phage system protease Avs1b n=2 Tax=Gammaproteobacteria TaxID=1236 RepID=UPI0032B3A8DC